MGLIRHSLALSPLPGWALLACAVQQLTMVRALAAHWEPDKTIATQKAKRLCMHRSGSPKRLPLSGRFW
jgi:hypothetical protein